MYKFIKGATSDNSSHTMQCEEYADDFDERYDKTFGEPTTEVFTVEEFNQWMDEVINFE